MQLIRIAGAVALCALAGCATGRTTTVESGGDVAISGGETPRDNRTLPVGATLTTRLDHTLGTKVSKTGDIFTATVSNTLYADDGSIVVPSGAKVEGRVTALDDSDNATDAALIRLAFERLSFNGRSYPFNAAIVQSSPVQSGGTSSSDRTKNIVIGGAVGAAIGAILGNKDLDKIVIGGALGAAAGSIISLGTEVNASLPAGSQMTLQNSQTVLLR